MNTAGGRIQSLINSLGLTRNSFAQKLGVSSTVINGIVKDSHKPGSKILDAIKREYPNVSTDWIISGEGGMSNGIAPKSNVVDNNYLHEHLKTLEENFERLTKQLENKDRQIEGLQRTVDSLLSRPGATANFLNGTPSEGRIVPLYPAQEKATA